MQIFKKEFRGGQKRGKNCKKGFTKLWNNWRGLTILKMASHMIPIILTPKIGIFGPSAKFLGTICRLPFFGDIIFGQNKKNFFWEGSIAFFDNF
jgi:hypothetical protein